MFHPLITELLIHIRPFIIKKLVGRRSPTKIGGNFFYMSIKPKILNLMSHSMEIQIKLTLTYMFKML